jgi:drug/metabolite transporter (DMT)-like permease
MSVEPSSSSPPRALVWLAFATVYVVWGSTYLAIRVAIETLPPFFMAGGRFLMAGGALFALLRLRGSPMPAKVHWQNAAISGFLLLVGGNGLVVWAEQTVPSGLTALLVGLVPVWFALIDWVRPAGPPPGARTVAGILVGFGGMTLLVVGNPGPARDSALNGWGALALVLAGLFWAGGSLFSRHNSKTESPGMTAALQMLCGGAMLMVLALATGEFAEVEQARISPRSVAALLYLVVFGSWIGFSAYVWLLKASKPSHVSTYAYVNPVIALFLGHLLLHEPITARVLLAAAIILAGVILITLPKGAIAANSWARRLLGAA